MEDLTTDDESSQISDDGSTDSELDAHLHTKGDFFGCYMLVSKNPSPKFKGRTYIGFTVDPNRRIRQHNRGCQKGGARKTSGRGPWEMVLIVHGFPNHIAALRFEWAWQNPDRSRRLGKAGQWRKKRSESALQYRFRIVTKMLLVGPWSRLPLTIRWLKQEYELQFPPGQQPPPHMPIAYGPVDLTTKSKRREPLPLTQPPTGMGGVSSGEDDDITSNQSIASCQFCDQDKNADLLHCYHKDCKLSAHVTCLAPHLCSSDPTPQLIPVSAPCPQCGKELLWGELIKRYKASQSQTKMPCPTRKKKRMSSSQPTSTLAPPPQPRRAGNKRGGGGGSHWTEQLHV